MALLGPQPPAEGWQARPRGGRSSCGVPSVRSVAVFFTFLFLLGWVYFYDFFSRLSFFFGLFFSFFPPVCMCLCVLSFQLGWESAGCSCLL